MKRTWLRVFLAALLGIALLLSVVLMASRIGDQARFVTWPVVAFTVLAAVVAVLGMWKGSLQPSFLVAGLLLALFVSYFLVAVPFPVVALGLVAIGAWAVTTGGLASGLAAGTGTLMVLAVVMQGPAVECGHSGVSGDSGPFWIAEASSGTVSGSATGDGSASGTIQVGGHHYGYACDGARLASFERLDKDADVPVLREPAPISPIDRNP